MVGISRPYDVAVIGGGVLGCAIASHFAARGVQVAVVDREAGVGRHASGQASGVLHSGIHLPANSFAARLCQRGRTLFHEYCHQRGVEHACRQKLFVATRREALPLLDLMMANARRLNVAEAQLVTRSEIASLEPEVFGLAGVLLPREIVVQPWTAVSAFATQAKKDGAHFLFRSTVQGISEERRQVRLFLDGGFIPARAVVNAAGTGALRLAQSCGLGRGLRLLQLWGDYFQLRRGSVHGLVSQLTPNVWPLEGGLHIDRLADGRIRIGPRGRLRVDCRNGPWAAWRLAGNRAVRNLAGRHLLGALRYDTFMSRVREILPRANPEAVSYEQTARRQAMGDGRRLVTDFLVLPGSRSVHLLNIASPGFTCTLSLAEHAERYVWRILGDQCRDRVA